MTARTQPCSVRTARPVAAAASRFPGSATVATPSSRAQTMTSGALVTTTTGSSPAAATTWVANRRESSARSSGPSRSARRSLPNANARMGATTPVDGTLITWAPSLGAGPSPRRVAGAALRAARPHSFEHFERAGEGLEAQELSHAYEGFGEGTGAKGLLHLLARAPP